MIRIQLPQEEADRLEELFRCTQDRKLRDRLQIVLMAHRGRPRQDIAADLGIHRIGVTRWLNAYCERGLDALGPRPRRGKSASIPETMAGEIRGWVIDGPAACGLDRANWTHEELAAHLGRTHGVSVKKSAVHEFCRRHGIRPYRPSYRFLRGDPRKQAEAAAELARLKKGRKTAGWSF